MTGAGNASPKTGEKSLIRGLMLVSVVTLAWAILTLGAASGEVDLRVGELATREYVAQRSSEVVDQEATEGLREAAADRVENVTIRDESMEQQVNSDLSRLFAVIRSGVIDPAPDWVSTLSLPPTSTTTTTITTTTSTTTTGAGTPPDEPLGAEDAVGGDAATAPGGEADPSLVTPDPTPAATDRPPSGVTLTGRVFLDFDSNAAITRSGKYPEFGLQLVAMTLKLRPTGTSGWKSRKGCGKWWWTAKTPIFPPVSPSIFPAGARPWCVLERTRSAPSPRFPSFRSRGPPKCRTRR